MRTFVHVSQSLEAIRANKFRAGVTIFIIALGITALVMVLTAVEGTKEGFRNSFSAMGTNTFRIQNRPSNLQVRRRGRRFQKFPNITYRESSLFKERYEAQGAVSVYGVGTGVAQVSYNQGKTNQNIQIIGTDENYLKTARYELEEGRTLNADDVEESRNIAVIGAEIKKLLFPFESPIGKLITANNRIYKVVGVFEELGSSSGSGGDKVVVIPISTLRVHYSNLGSLTLNVYVEDAARMDYYMDEATGTMRLVRGLMPRDENNFGLIKSDAFVEQLMENLAVLTISATVIALITLLGASVALLNVMLVSVTERTNEIGLRKALGATERSILNQFLVESIVICQVGGVLGALMGMAGGNFFSIYLMETGVIIPWGWLMAGLAACFVVGLASGFYPARKAARVDPIESLRHV